MTSLYSLLVLGIIFFLFPVLVQGATAKQNTIADFIAQGLKKGKKTNALIHEKSPYLLQHAFNPVHWFPWGDEALTKAKQEDKPIFLSIGYSTCHWCHVMAHESFENEALAEFLNRHFVCIKVDREERPDLDHIYMAATQALTGHGGWPMSIFLTPDLKPFYAGTYFPPQASHGMPGFIDVLQSIRKAWQDNRANILNAADNITEHLKKTSAKSPVELDKSVFDRAYKLIAQKYDAKFGGFGEAPKFPRPVVFNYLLRYHHKNGTRDALDMTTATLRKMAEGGMYDQLGGGFHRYSVDAQWRVPHFEKMLYDQSQLAISYLEAYQISGDDFFKKIASETLDYVLRDLPDPKGGFYSAEDADSPLPENPDKHAEGAFYVWTQKEIEQLLGKEQNALVNHYYGIEPGGNALSDPQGEFTGKNILHIADTMGNTAERFDIAVEQVAKIITSSHEKLFAARSKRPRPHLDDKVITSWNGLMISALAKGYQALGEERYLTAARKCADFIMDNLYDSSTHRLFRRYRDGDSGLDALLEDYAFLVQGLLDLYEAAFEITYLQKAMLLNETQVSVFGDAAGGGFFNAPGDDPTILLKMKNDYDGAEPAGNSVAALNLLRLAQMTGNTDWQTTAVRTINTFAGNIKEYPPLMPQMLVAYYFQNEKPMQVIIAGKPDSPTTDAMLHTINSMFLPHKIILLADNGTGQKFLTGHLPFMQEMRPIDGKTTAYICENYTCRQPTNEVEKMKTILEKNL